MQGATDPLPQAIKVVGMGSAVVDYLAQVAAFPQPDDKLRTERLEAQGGGNAGNALTAAARLGLAPTIVSKIGGDSLGDGIVAELEREGIATQHILRAAGAPSPFTYILVDRSGGTRTCIHTPGEAFFPEELTPELAAAVLEGAALVYFDGRLTEAALRLAAAARGQGVPVLVEAERLRPQLEELLQYADYVITSAHFPQKWTGEGCLGDALAVAFQRLPHVQWMVTTLGKRGSVMLQRPEVGLAEPAEPAVAEDLVEQLFQQAAASAGASGSREVACISSAGVEIGLGATATAAQPHLLQLRRSEADGARAAASAAAAAAAEAASNADAGSGSRYAGRAAGAASDPPPVALVTVAQAAHLPPQAVLDTTGAGDAFIGTMCYCIATGKPMQQALQLAGVVAACKCTALGARPGLPHRAELAAALL